MTELPGIGALTPDEQFDDRQLTPEVGTRLMGPRQFTVEGLGEGDEAEAAAVIRAFAELGPQAVRDAATEEVFENYHDMADEFDADEREEYGIPEIESPEGVWDHVTWGRWPLLVRDDDGVWYISLENECAWEPEHGLLLTFREGVTLDRVSSADGLLHADD